MGRILHKTNMDDPRQELLALFEDIHTRYDLKESDYKTFVETLVKFNRKPRINVEGAKYVRITWTRVQVKESMCVNCDQPCDVCCCDPQLHTECFKRIFRVVDECSFLDTFDANFGYEICEQTLKTVRTHLEENDYCFRLCDDVIVVKELEVLEREEVTSE